MKMYIFSGGKQTRNRMIKKSKHIYMGKNTGSAVINMDDVHQGKVQITGSMQTVVVLRFHGPANLLWSY